ncbi:MAG: hypothetical protein R3326_00685 [Gemmatimonadota bacterium]|nr:hypothetical protein [Gemmatimonadota bacterium]
MQIVDAGMLAFAAWHALKGKIDWPLTYQVPRMLRPLVEDAADTYVLCWNGETLWKRDRWPDYRDRPEIWDEADRDDFEAMLEVLTALGAVQYRTDPLEADEAIAAIVHRFEGEEDLVLRSDDKDFMQLLSGSTWMEGRVRGEVRFGDVKEILGVTPAYVVDLLALAGDQADGIPRIVPPAMARELIISRGHVRDWIDRDLRIDEKTKRAIEENREQLRLNLELVDLSESAVESRGAPGEPRLDGWGDLDRAREIGERADISWLTDDDLEEAYRPLTRWGETTRERLGV